MRRGHRPIACASPRRILLYAGRGGRTGRRAPRTLVPDQPIPTPSVSRAPHSTSSVAACLADTIGLCSGSSSTPVASPIVVVTAAAKLRPSSGSRQSAAAEQFARRDRLSVLPRLPSLYVAHRHPSCPGPDRAVAIREPGDPPSTGAGAEAQDRGNGRDEKCSGEAFRTASRSEDGPAAVIPATAPSCGKGVPGPDSNETSRRFDRGGPDSVRHGRRSRLTESGRRRSGRCTQTRLNEAGHQT
jgi:hypothetical protein